MKVNHVNQRLRNLPEPLKRRAVQILREKEWRRNDLALNYVPLPGLKPFHLTMKRYAIIFGGNRSGKTQGNMAQLALIFRNLHPCFKDKDIDVMWACTKTFEMCGKVLWEEKLLHMIPRREIGRIVWYNKARNIPLEIYSRDGSRRIEFKAYDQGRELFQARSVPYVVCDEQLPRDIWQEIQMRVADRDGWIRFSATPLIYQQWLKEIADNPPSEYWVGYASLEENRKSRGGYVSDEVIDSLIEEWPESVRITRVEGRFAGFLGAVFSEWNPELSIVNPRILPKSWEWYIGVDFGYSNPFAALLMARDPDGAWWITSEHYHSHMLIEDHAAVLRSWMENYPIKAIYGDHAAQERAELAAKGIHVRPARKEVKNAIDCVHSKMKVLGNGRPKLYVFRKVRDDVRGCPNLLREIPGYRWAEPTESRNAKEEPLKLDDHAVDAMKMCIYSVEKIDDSQKGRGGSLG